MRNRNLKHRYGIDLAMFDAMLQKQNGCCAICGASQSDGAVKTLNIDHCHKTKKIRELLCRSCNLVLGLVGEDPERLQKMIDYINKHNDP